jgi:hypothetical protein
MSGKELIGHRTNAWLKGAASDDATILARRQRGKKLQ